MISKAHKDFCQQALIMGRHRIPFFLFLCWAWRWKCKGSSVPPSLPPPVGPVDGEEVFQPTSLIRCHLFISLLRHPFSCYSQGGKATLRFTLRFLVSPSACAVNGSASQLIRHVYEWRRSWGEAGGALPGVAYTFLACPLLSWSYLPLAMTAIKHVAGRRLAWRTRDAVRPQPRSVPPSHSALDTNAQWISQERPEFRNVFVFFSIGPLFEQILAAGLTKKRTNAILSHQTPKGF